jgi:hypothetical protein
LQLRVIEAEALKPGSEIVVTGALEAFDYSWLPKEHEFQLRKFASELKTGGRQECGAAVKRGETLIQAKPLLKAQRRKFGEWLDVEAGLHPRTAQLLMSLARLAAKEPDLPDLVVVAIGYKLAERATPPEIVSQVLTAARNGEPVSLAWVKALIDEKKNKKSEPERKNITSDVAEIAKRLASALQPEQTARLRRLLEASPLSLIQYCIAEFHDDLEHGLASTGAAQSTSQEQVAAL